MKKNICLAQANYLHGRATFLPYAAGTLIANAKADPALCDYYEFSEPLFLREDVEKVVAKIDNPYLFGFSNYIWNHEYNRVLAKRIKEEYPECIIVFGGHHITPDSSLMLTENYIDVMIFGEGEEIFALLLTALKNGTDLSEVPNIAYRENGKPVESKKAKICGIDYPSPYLTGVFDSIFENYPEYDFHAIFETNRGCPYNCAYCDWGSLHSGVRFFSEEKILAELGWFSAHNISAFGCADANFGMFERDEKFVDEMVRLKKEQGVFSMLQASYAKNSNDRVFSITQKLNDCGMNKGATLSFQSLSEPALANVNRKNISVDTFTALLNRYNQAGIATYTELILGLPGETPEQLKESCQLSLRLDHGNFIHNFNHYEILPLSEFYKEYTKTGEYDPPKDLKGWGKINATEYVNNSMSKIPYTDLNVVRCYMLWKNISASSNKHDSDTSYFKYIKSTIKEAARNIFRYGIKVGIPWAFKTLTTFLHFVRYTYFYPSILKKYGIK